MIDLLTYDFSVLTEKFKSGLTNKTIAIINEIVHDITNGADDPETELRNFIFMLNDMYSLFDFCNDITIESKSNGYQLRWSLSFKILSGNCLSISTNLKSCVK